MGPIPNSRDKTMLDGIDMDVINVSRKIVLIANGVLPIPPLLDASFSLANTAA